MQTSPLEQNQGPFSFTSTTKLNHPCFFSSPVEGEKQLPSYQVKYEHHSYCSRNILAENLPSSNCLNLQRVISSSAVGILKVFDCKSETKEPLWIQVLAIHSQNTISLFHFLRRNGNHPPWRYLVLKAKPKNSHCPQSTCFSPGHPAEKNARGTAYGQHAQFFLSSGKGTQWHRFLQNLNLAQEDNRRQSKGKQWTRAGLMVPSEPSSLPHSSGSSLQRPAYRQTTHTHTDIHTHAQGTITVDQEPGIWEEWKVEGGDSPSRWVGLSSPCGLGGKPGGDTTSVRRRSQPDEHPGAWREATSGKCFFVSAVFWLRLVTGGSHRLPPAPWAHQGSFTRSSERDKPMRSAAYVRPQSEWGTKHRAGRERAVGTLGPEDPYSVSAQTVLLLRAPREGFGGTYTPHTWICPISWQRNQLIIPWQGYKSCEAHQAVAFCNSSEWLKWCLILNYNHLGTWILIGSNGGETSRESEAPTGSHF